MDERNIKELFESIDKQLALYHTHLNLLRETRNFVDGSHHLNELTQEKCKAQSEPTTPEYSLKTTLVAINNGLTNCNNMFEYLNNQTQESLGMIPLKKK